MKELRAATEERGYEQQLLHTTSCFFDATRNDPKTKGHYT